MDEANPKRIARQNTSRGEKEDPGAVAAREAFYATRGPTQPPGGKGDAWRRRGRWCGKTWKAEDGQRLGHRHQTNKEADRAARVERKRRKGEVPHVGPEEILF